MTAQPKQIFIFAAPAAIQIRRRPSRPVDVATHTVAANRAGGGTDAEFALVPVGGPYSAMRHFMANHTRTLKPRYFRIANQ